MEFDDEFKQKPKSQRQEDKARRELVKNIGAAVGSMLAVTGLAFGITGSEQMPGRQAAQAVETGQTPVKASPNVVAFYPGVRILKTPAIPTDGEPDNLYMQVPKNEVVALNDVGSFEDKNFQTWWVGHDGKRTVFVDATDLEFQQASGKKTLYQEFAPVKEDNFSVAAVHDGVLVNPSDNAVVGGLVKMPVQDLGGYTSRLSIQQPSQ